MKKHSTLVLCLFMLLCASLAPVQIFPQSGQVQSVNELRVLWRFDTGG